MDEHGVRRWWAETVHSTDSRHDRWEKNWHFGKMNEFKWLLIYQTKFLTTLDSKVKELNSAGIRHVQILEIKKLKIVEINGPVMALVAGVDDPRDTKGFNSTQKYLNLGHHGLLKSWSGRIVAHQKVWRLFCKLSSLGKEIYWGKTVKKLTWHILF